jgi:RHS repeat-associated protein
MTYLADGSLASHTDFSSATRTFEYDSMGRLVRRNEPDGRQIAFTYTASGQRASVTTPLGTTTYEYDGRDLLTRVTQPGGEGLTYTYDLAGRLTELAVFSPSATALGPTRFQYGLDDHPSSIVSPDGGLHTLDYDTNGNLVSVAYPNGVATQARFDARDRLIELRTTDAQGTLLEHFQDTLDPTGRRARSLELDGTTREYSYDALGRVLEETVTDGLGALLDRSVFTYDSVGNRTRWERTDATGATEVTDFTYDVRDRLTSAGTRTFGWDADGNLLSITGDGALTFEWDSENRLKRAVRPDGTTLTTDYDADGNRIRSTLESAAGDVTTRHFVVDPSGALSHTVAEFSNAGDPLAVYTRLEDQLLASYRPQEGASEYYHPDSLGSIRYLTDTAGQVSDRYSYSAYGLENVPRGSRPNAYRFAGEPAIPELGLSYLRARWMMPELGAFVSMDPFEGDPQQPLSLHKYLYAHGDPINNTDPSGYFVGGITSFVVSFAVRAVVGGIIGAVIGGAFGGVDAFLGGRDVSQGIKDGATFGAIFGALGSLNFLRPVLAAVGLGFGVVGTFQAILDEDWDLAIFRGVTLLAGAFLTWRAYSNRNVRMIDPAELRWSQRDAGGKGRADAMRLSIGKNGWKGPPIDAVETADGIVTLDHTRAAVALELGIRQIPVRVHQPQSLLPWSMRNSYWNRFGNTARTWAEAVALRAFGQRPPLPNTGTPKPPKLRYGTKPP